MSQEGYETIDGHRYYVKRDDDGKSVSQVAADQPPPPPARSPEETEARQIIAKDPALWLPADRDKLLRFITKALLRTGA